VGNLATQALATGQLQDAAAIRELVRRSFRLKTYRPRSTDAWDRHASRYLEICNKSKTQE
jgi:rhamnulokinase